MERMCLFCFLGLILFNFRTIKKVSMIGDEAQLPPYGHNHHLNSTIPSVFDSYKSMGKRPVFLDLQHRVPRFIANILSEVSYESRLRTAQEKEKIGREDCLFWLDVRGKEAVVEGNSKVNEAEVEMIKHMLEFLQKDLELPTLVLSGYTAQVSRLKVSLWHIPNVNVKTIDSAQGREYARVVISAVSTENVGILDDIRRTNVALSRVQVHLVIVGDHSFWMLQEKTVPAIAKLAQNACVMRMD
jgi:superfamily I DNA and/or RNA helicase